MESNQNVIAIDGPSGCGKSTLAQRLAQELELQMIDTGALFRTLALFLHETMEEGDSLEADIGTLLSEQEFQYRIVDGKVRVQCNGHDFSSRIREHSTSALASKFSGLAPVREFVKKWERKIVAESSKTSILEGRDIGTVIFPNAKVKFFLTADSRVRAERRYQQLSQAGQLNDLTLDQIQKDIEARDLADRTREIAPLLKADDAIEVDTSSLNIDEVCTLMRDKIKQSL
jgi:cytidylate kinase